jgi:hypothetical protein
MKEIITVIAFHYIHQNPFKAKLVEKLEDCKYSSFPEYAGCRNSNLCDKELAWELISFNKETFITEPIKWAIATHDLIYKSNEINWAKQRVAFQVKAMLENAEISIEKASTLKKIPGIPLTNEKVELQNNAKNFLCAYWSADRLPKDLIRLIDNVIQLLKILDLDLQILEKDLLEEIREGRGNLTLNLSPYLVILQTLINQQTQKVNNHIKKDNKKKILIPGEVDTTKIVHNINGKNVIRI